MSNRIRLIPLFILGLATVLFSAEKNPGKFILKRFHEKNFNVVWLDINEDGKVDRIEKKIGDKIKIIQIDSDLKGKINSTTEYFDYSSDINPIEVTKTDSNYDGNIDRIETVYRNQKLQKFITAHEVDSTFSGQFDKKYTTDTDIVQKETPALCSSDQTFDDIKIARLTADIGNIQLNLENGYYNSDFGYKIHQSCLQNWGGREFVSTLKESMSKGFQCLRRLAQESASANRTPNGALANLQNLDQLLSRSPVTITCNQQKYDWSRVVAHASTSASDTIAEGNVRHPYISINPSNPKTKSRMEPKERGELSKTLFHEQLHNLGIRHNEGIEYPYTCETCCLSDNNPDSRDAVDAACKVCSGNYSGPRDPNYLRDLVQWGRKDYQEDRAARMVTNYQKEFPGDRDAMVTYAEATNNIFNPVGIQIARQLRTRHNDLSQEQQNRLAAVENEFAQTFTNPQVNRMAEVAARAYTARYLDNSPKNMMDEIERNKSEIRSLINRTKTATGNDQYVLGSIRTEVKRMLTDTWMNGYPNNRSPESDRAYKILNDLGLI